MLVYGTNAVFPEPVFPFRSRQVILKDSLVAVQSHHLAGLLFKSHLREEVFYPVFKLGLRIFIYVFPAVFVEIYPSVPVHRMIKFFEFEDFLPRLWWLLGLYLR